MTPDTAKEEKQRLDTRLLSDAVIELNISRRSVGLYPRDHPITRESIEKAFGLLQKLFEIRHSITLGIAKDSLLVDEFVFDRKNQVFHEFALSLHSKGIAAITFHSGLTIDELLDFHSLIALRDLTVGEAIVSQAEQKGIRHIRLQALDLSKFSFAEGKTRQGEEDLEIWENYIYGLLAGKLTGSDADAVVFNAMPEDIASCINCKLDQGAAEGDYEKIITIYLKDREDTRVRSERFSKFAALVRNLRPEIKNQFLTDAITHHAMSSAEIERLLAWLTRDEMEKIMGILSTGPTSMPASVKNLLDRLKISGPSRTYFDMLSDSKAVISEFDIEIDDNLLNLFSDDKFRSFVSDDYSRELAKMMGPQKKTAAAFYPKVADECKEEVIEKKFAEMTLEFVFQDSVTREEFLELLTPIANIVSEYLETGRFLEISDIYNTIYSIALTGKFREDAANMLDYYFHSEDFIGRLMESIRLWGRFNRDGVIRLLNVQKRFILDRLFDELSKEKDSAVRKFLIQILGSLGSGVLEEAVKRLSDGRWYVVRNMIYLIRQMEGRKHLQHIRRLAASDIRKISYEAVKTLLHFNTPDAFSHIQRYFQGNNQELRKAAIDLSGQYRLSGAVSHLLSILAKRDLMGSDSFDKLSVIRALNKIGDPSVLEPFIRLYRSRTFFYHSTFHELKLEMFRGLHNYPDGSMAALAKLGLDDRNDTIRSICKDINGKAGKICG